MGDIITTATLLWHSCGPVLVPTFLHHLPLSFWLYFPTHRTRTWHSDYVRARIVLNTETLIHTLWRSHFLQLCCLFKVYFQNICLVLTTWLEYLVFYILVLQYFIKMISMCFLCLSSTSKSSNTCPFTSFQQTCGRKFMTTMNIATKAKFLMRTTSLVNSTTHSKRWDNFLRLSEFKHWLFQKLFHLWLFRDSMFLFEVLFLEQVKNTHI